MKFNTFYKIYYSHRIKKSSLILKLYIFIKLPFVYLVNKLLFKPKIDLDKFSDLNSNFFDKQLESILSFLGEQCFFSNMLYYIILICYKIFKISGSKNNR